MMSYQGYQPKESPSTHYKAHTLTQTSGSEIRSANLIVKQHHPLQIWPEEIVHNLDKSCINTSDGKNENRREFRPAPKTEER